jgi:hypothetical protein
MVGEETVIKGSRLLILSRLFTCYLVALIRAYVLFLLSSRVLLLRFDGLDKK